MSINVFRITVALISLVLLLSTSLLFELDVFKFMATIAFFIAIDKLAMDIVLKIIISQNKETITSLLNGIEKNGDKDDRSTDKTIHH